MKNATILIRSEGDDGLNYGMGHIYRSIAICKAFEKTHKIFFITSSKLNIVRFIKKNLKCTVIRLKKEKFEKIKKIFNKSNILINDTFGKMQKINRYAELHNMKIVSFDDLNPSFKKGIIINAISHYRKKIKNFKMIKYYGGFKYLILRDIFNKDYHTKRKKGFYFVSSGGSDSKNYLNKITNLLIKLNPKKIFCLVEIAVKKNNPIFNLSRRNKKVRLLTNISNPIPYLKKSEFSIVSGGTIAFESVLLNCKTITVQSHHHQIFASKYLNRKKLIIDLGKLEDISFKKISKTLLEINKKKIFFNSPNKIIDNLGKKRVVKILNNYINEKRNSNNSSS